MEPDNPLLDRYILRQSRKRKPSICFLPTASAESESYIQRFLDVYAKLPCKPSVLSLFRPPGDLAQFVLGQDVIFVGGGNTKSMLALWREWRLDRILRRAWRNGVVLSGISAGSICWFEEGLTDSIPTKLGRLACLGFLAGSNCPHYDGEAERRPRYRQLVARGAMRAGLAADDGVALHFRGRRLAGIVSSRRDASAHSLKRTASGLKETTLEARYLGGKRY